MKTIFDAVSLQCSKATTKAYSTSFSIGIRFLSKNVRNHIYAIYGFVRLADEIVDSFHGYNKQFLLDQFEQDTYLAIDQGISLNPILNSFQFSVNKNNIDKKLISSFLTSMRTDLVKVNYDQTEYEDYIYGSAEVVGLMCLKVFVQGNTKEYNKLIPQARKLGAAFQKINFLRDLKSDYQLLGRSYFPQVDLSVFDAPTKRIIEEEIEKDFKEAYEGIKQLPRNARFGVFVAYMYYYKLFCKIRKQPCVEISRGRVRISNPKKYYLFFTSYIRHSLNLL